jgi:hypothetical protein
MLVGVAVLVLLSRSRLSVLGWIAVCAVPLLPALPLLLDPYSAAAEGVVGAADELQRAAFVILAEGVAVSLLAVIVIGSEDRFRLSERSSRRIGLALTVAAALAIVVPLGVVVARDGGPADFLDRRVDELSSGSPDFRENGTRLGVNLGSERGELWAVAIDEGSARPVLGSGAGGFEYSFLAQRDDPSQLTSEDPHSVFLLMLSELGVIGLALFSLFAAAAALGAWRARRLGPAANALSAAALAALAYWLVHASVDWFWHYPAVTAPVVALLGAACAPALRVLEPGERGRARLAAAGALVVLALVQVPLFLSERYVRDGAEKGADLTAAYADLERAADLNPWSPAPLIKEGELAEAAGEPQRGLAALAEAQERKPEDWTAYYLEARILAQIDPAAARRALDEAERLNPQGQRILDAQAALDDAESP